MDPCLQNALAGLEVESVHSPLTGPAMPCMRFSGFEMRLYVCGGRERKGSSSCDVGGVVSFTSRHGNGQGREKYALSSSRMKDRGRLQNSVLIPIRTNRVFRSTNSKDITPINQIFLLYFIVDYLLSSNGKILH